MIELEGVSREFAISGERFHAVRDVTMKVDKGASLSIVGHSGSGKTTLLSIIGGILRPTTGSFRFEGRDILSLDDDGLSAYRADRVGYIFQFASLMTALTALENMLLPTIFRTGGSRGQADIDLAAKYLKRVGLGDRLLAHPGQLSGGQQRRVAIARAFMNDPALILADEPTGDLDENTEAEVMNFIVDTCRERSITFIMVTHNTKLAALSDRRMRMTEGRLVEE